MHSITRPRAILRGGIILALLGTFILASAPAGLLYSPTALSAPSQDEKDNDRKKNNRGSKDLNDNNQERDARGQVLAIRKDLNPQELDIADLSGTVVVKLMKANLLSQTGVGVGDHIRVTGEKISERLFEATEVHIRTRCCGEPRSDNDDDSDNVSDSEEDNENR